MSERRPPRLADIPHQLREQMQNLPDRWRAWREGLREDPAALWRTPLVRLCGVILLAILAIVILAWLIETLVPGGGSQRVEKPTPLATLYVACTNPACRAHYPTKQPMDFTDWPLTCEKCGQPTVYRATRCDVCRKWFAVPPGSPRTCPFCAEQATPLPVEDAREHGQPTTDDDEDPW